MAGRREKAERRAGTFDAFDVALRRASFAGTLSATSLPRVADRLAPEGGASDVSWRIAGTKDVLGRPALEIGLDGAVPLVCQRCLQPFSWPLTQRTMLLLARDERELARLDAEDEHEVVLAAAPVETAMLVEDELLLTLPFAPRCGRAACAETAMSAVGAERMPALASSFTVLAEMKRPVPKKAKD